MKNPLKIGTVIKKQVYTVPGFTNSYGQKVEADNTTIKIYSPDTTESNSGVMPESLLKVVLNHYEQKDKLTRSEKMVKEALHSLVKLYKS